MRDFKPKRKSIHENLDHFNVVPMTDFTFKDDETKTANDTQPCKPRQGVNYLESMKVKAKLNK